MKTGNCDPRALRVAQAVHERQNPQATILFGSRIRGDHEDLRSDIDIMSVLPEEPGSEHRGTGGSGVCLHRAGAALYDGHCNAERDARQAVPTDRREKGENDRDLLSQYAKPRD